MIDDDDSCFIINMPAAMMPISSLICWVDQLSVGILIIIRVHKISWRRYFALWNMCGKYQIL